MIKRAGGSNSTKIVLLTVMTFAFLFVTLLYITEIRLYGASKTSLWHLHEARQSLHQLMCNGTKTEINEKTQVINRLNPDAKDLLVEAVNEANLNRETIEKHLHKDWFLSPSSLPYNLLGTPDDKRYFAQEK